jgi:hypothetical protein
MTITNPSPTSPTSASADSRTDASDSAPVCDGRQPSVGIRVALNPETPAGTTNSEIPYVSSDVRAATSTQSAREPLVQNTFDPSSTHPSPSRTARVVNAATSDPAPGSVTASPATAVPATHGATQRARCSGVPNRCT